MTTLRTLLAALLVCAAPAQAQTLKSLMYNTTNNAVVQTQRLTFTLLGVASGTAATPSLTYASGTNNFGTFAASQLGVGPYLGFSVDGTRRFYIATNTIRAELPISFGGTTNAAETRTNLELGAFWLTNNNVTNFRTAIGLGATNNVLFNSIETENNATIGGDLTVFNAIQFSNTAAATTRTNLGLGAAWLTNNNVTNFNAAIGLADEPDSGGYSVTAASGLWDSVQQERGLAIVDGDPIFGSQGSNAWRIALGLGATNIVTFAGLTNNGDIRINQTATNNGLLYIYRTNAEPFLGLANLIASNNVTVSNETLFRVGVQEATNKAAQFGFRSTNTNGNGVAVFSVFGYNALMMIGPSDPNAGTNPIQATVYSIAPTNKVMTLITTNTGAMQMHRPIGIDTAGVSTNAPANTTNVAGWIQFYVGTNSVRVPYYQ